MATYVSFKHPRTGELKSVKVGLNWPFFFFGNLFGLPLFFKRLYIWGFVFLALTIADILFDSSLVWLADCVLTGWFLWNGNEMVAKNYLEQGWLFAEPHAEATKLGRIAWKVTI